MSVQREREREKYDGLKEGEECGLLEREKIGLWCVERKRLAAAMFDWEVIERGGEKECGELSEGEKNG